MKRWTATVRDKNGKPWERVYYADTREDALRQVYADGIDLTFFELKEG